MRICGSGHRHLSGQHRPHGSRRRKGCQEAQDAAGRPLPDLRAGPAGTDAGKLRLGAAAIHRQRQGRREGCRGRLPLRRHAAQAGRHRRHELSSKAPARKSAMPWPSNNNEYMVTIIVKSTVPAGTNRKLYNFLKQQTKAYVQVVSNPEFLKEGTAVQDFLNPTASSSAANPPRRSA